jgi:predicted O-methyltransferase YrrM
MQGNFSSCLSQVTNLRNDKAGCLGRQTVDYALRWRSSPRGESIRRRGRVACPRERLQPIRVPLQLNDYLMLEQTVPSLTKTAVLERAHALLPKFQEAIADIPPEAGFGGIWESELLLFYAAVQPLGPKQILESGRARGKSTLVLARCFPEVRIVSVELDSASLNAAAAEAKLRPYHNVELVYGDSRQILPQRLQHGDAVLIDGPKDFRALELALDLLRTGKPCLIFVHDFPPRTPWRRFVERHWREEFFGDDPIFEPFRTLDDERDPRRDQRRRAYGVFVCLPPELPAPSWRLRLSLLFTRALRRVF